MMMNCGCHVLQEFVSFCEAMELLPKEELETSVHGGSNQMVDRRARKVLMHILQKYLLVFQIGSFVQDYSLPNS